MAWHLRLSSFGGLVGGASHWYAEIVDDNDLSTKHYVKYTLTPEQADRFNRLDDTAPRLRGGMKTSRFESKEVAKSAAVELWRELGCPGGILFRDAPYYMDRRVLATC